jgi:hypothetical protein
MPDRPATTFLRLALRRAARGTGSQLSFYARRTSMQPLPDLLPLLHGIRWALIGGLALRAYMPERMTLDVDVLIHDRDASVVRAAFVAAGYRVIGLLSVGGFTVQMPDSEAMPIDVLTRADPWLDDALAQPVYDSAGYPVLSRPYLVLIKLQAGRTQDLADVQRLLAQTPSIERTAIRALVETFSPELVEDYDSLVSLADLEFGPPRAEQP